MTSPNEEIPKINDAGAKLHAAIEKIVLENISAAVGGAGIYPFGRPMSAKIGEAVQNELEGVIREEVKRVRQRLVDAVRKCLEDPGVVESLAQKVTNSLAICGDCCPTCHERNS